MTKTPKKIKLSRVQLFPDGTTPVTVPLSAFTEVTTSASVGVDNNTGLIIISNNINNNLRLEISFYSAAATINLTKGTDLNLRYYVHNSITHSRFYAYFFDETPWTVELFVEKNKSQRVALTTNLFEFVYN